MRRRFRMAQLLLLLAFVPCISFTAAQVQGIERPERAITWQPDIEFDAQLFPAFVLAMANRKATPTDPSYIGDPNGVIGIRARATRPDTHFRLSVAVDGLSAASTLEGTLKEANREYRVFPNVRYDSRTLMRIDQSYPTNVLISVSANGGAAEEKTVPIQVRSVHDVPLSWQGEDGKVHDSTFLFGSFVNENHPWIDQLLSEALKHGAIRSFRGYQAGSQEVERQVFAIWNVLQRRDVRYSSITRASGESGRVRSQHVRFLDEAINNAQANCVDGSLIFASVLYKLDMCPVLVLMPGHMFVGIHVDAASCGTSRNLVFLETTLVGNPGLGRVERTWPFQTQDGYLASKSYRLYVNARQVGDQRFRSIIPHLQAKEPGYHVIDVSEARKFGISAIAHPPD